MERGKVMPQTAFLYYLDFEGTPTQGWTISDKPLIVGRGDVATACVADDSLSRSHFMVVAEAGEYFLVDLESQNGTWMDGHAVSGRKLHSGDLIRAGKSLFLFACGTGAADPASVLASVQLMLQADNATRAAA